MMLTLNTPAGPIEVYDSLQTLSAKRYAAFNVRWCDAAGLGSDIRAADNHLSRLAMFLGAGDAAAATAEFNNYLMGVDLMRRAYATDVQLLATLVASVGGVPCTDTTDDGYSRTAQLLLESGITQAQVEDTVAEVRGKWLRR